MIDNLRTLIQDNPLPAVLIGVAVLLLIALLVLLVLWLRRRNAAGETTINVGVENGGGEWQPSSPALASVNSGGFGGMPTVGAGRAATGAPTVSPGVIPASPATSAPTALPGATPGYAPSPAFGSMPQPPSAGGHAPAGGTVVLDRSPRPKHVAILIDRRDASKRHDLRAETDIGRAQTNAIAIADTTVSRQHARIRLQDDRFELFDLASANGTFINGQKVEQPRTLTDGDVVRFGDVEFVFKQLT
jgi:hypothetical protein